MTNANEIQRLADILSGASSRTEASYTVISLKEEVITKHASEITTLLKSIGYKDADNCIEKNEVWLNRQSSFWVEPILFENLVMLPTY